jgi:NADPH:quinone reductase-like Zn-dependent oxidoreductase
VLGIEAVGIVESAPNTLLEPGQKVAAIMGGMGRQFNGSYAEYTLVPESSVFVLKTELDWATLGAIPEMFQTVMGSLTIGLEVQAGQTLLIRGGSSSIGMTATRLAKDMGLTILSTTRNPNKIDKLKANGVDHVINDDGDIVRQVHELYPGGVDRVLELIGTKTLLNSLQTAKPGGIVCMTGILGGEWTLANFTPMEDIPTGVKLTSYAGEANNLSQGRLQAFVDDVASGRQTVNLDKTFKLTELPNAHRYLESNQASGKVVVVID